ncbi:MAG: hypothetical protein AAF438_13805, partial [Pseudomonadota bacterium]
MRGEEDTYSILRDVIEAEEVNLDRWTIVFHYQDESQVQMESTSAGPGSALEDQTSMIIMNNYFG